VGGCVGPGETWEPATWAARAKLVLRGAELWELAGRASQGGQAMGQSPGQLLGTQGCSSTSGLSQEVSGMGSDLAALTSSPGLSSFTQATLTSPSPGEDEPTLSSSLAQAFPFEVVHLLLASPLCFGRESQNQRVTAW